METRYQTRDCYLHRQIAGQDILISLGGNIANFNGYVALNSTSSFLWDAMAQPAAKETLIQALLEEFLVTEAVARNDVEEFLAVLLEKDMIMEVSCEEP